MTRMRKALNYRRGNYWCEAPPVSTDEWGTLQWIEWIDSHGGWIEDPEA